MKNYKWALASLSLWITSCVRIGHSLPEELKSITLIDKITHTKYVLDSTHTHVTAIDSSGKQIWKINPRLEYRLPDYRVSNPYIDYFALLQHGYDSMANEAVIRIRYNNSQFGDLSTKTGMFTLLGED